MLVIIKNYQDKKQTSNKILNPIGAAVCILISFPISFPAYIDDMTVFQQIYSVCLFIVIAIFQSTISLLVLDEIKRDKHLAKIMVDERSALKKVFIIYITAYVIGMMLSLSIIGLAIDDSVRD